MIKFLKKIFLGLSIKLSCLLGLHAWYDGVCVNCGKRR